MKITTQLLHKVIQEKISVKSSMYSPSQKIDRQTYDIYTGIKGVYGIFTGKPELMTAICEALDNAGIKYDNSEIARGFVKVAVFQK